METKSIIQSSVNVVKITNLKVGDMFKIIDDGYGLKMKYGVVLGLFNTGKKAFVEAIVYDKSYDSVKGELKVFGGDSDINIFPAFFEEVSGYFNDSIKYMEKNLKEKEEELIKHKYLLQKAKEFASGELSATLTTPDFKVLTQEEFLVEQRQAQIKALESKPL